MLYMKLFLSQLYVLWYSKMEARQCTLKNYIFWIMRGCLCRCLWFVILFFICLNFEILNFERLKWLNVAFKCYICWWVVFVHVVELLNTLVVICWNYMYLNCNCWQFEQTHFWNCVCYYLILTCVCVVWHTYWIRVVWCFRTLNTLQLQKINIGILNMFFKH